MTRIWDFEVELNRSPLEAELDTIFEIWQGDCTPTMTDDGRGTMMCHRDATSLLDAVASVVRDTRKISGLWVTGIVHFDTVTLGEAGLRLGRSTQSMHQLAKGDRGPGGFPQPKNPESPTRFYSYAEITAWMRTALGLDVPESNLELVLADMLIRAGVLADAIHRSPTEFYERTAA